MNHSTKCGDEVWGTKCRCNRSRAKATHHAKRRSPDGYNLTSRRVLCMVFSQNVRASDFVAGSIEAFTPYRLEIP